MAIEQLKDNGIIGNQQNKFFRGKKSRCVVDDKILILVQKKKKEGKKIKNNFCGNPIYNTKNKTNKKTKTNKQ